MGRFNASGNRNSGLTQETGTLDLIEKEGLIYMLEEEKLAHDVYVTLYEQWGVSIFQNIANSEQRHESQVESLIDKYSLENPVGDNPVGVFVNPELQQLYDDLIAQGSQSLTEALKVGVIIEETDIVDLQTYINQTDNADIQQVYERLLSGSENHLSAFTSNLLGESENINSSNSNDSLTGTQINQGLVGNSNDDDLSKGNQPENNSYSNELGENYGLNSFSQIENNQSTDLSQNLSSSEYLTAGSDNSDHGNILVVQNIQIYISPDVFNSVIMSPFQFQTNQ